MEVHKEDSHMGKYLVVCSCTPKTRGVYSGEDRQLSRV